MRHSQIIDRAMLDEISAQASASDRLRQNYNFHESLEDTSQRMLNAMEPGTEMPIHRHDVDETYVVLRGSLKALEFNDKGEVISEDVLNPIEGSYGIHIPAGTWHSLVVLDSGTVIFEARRGPYKPRQSKDIMNKKL
jgi:cupin fold WbuC family metalloprotein